MGISKRILKLGMLAGLCWVPALHAGAFDIPSAFEQGMAALEQDDQNQLMRSVDALQAQIETQPMAIYLQARWLDDRVDQQPADVANFLADHPDAPLVSRIKRRYLAYLAELEEWRHYLAVYAAPPERSATTSMQCWKKTALIELEGGLSDDQTQAALSIWTRGSSQPEACDPVFAYLEEQQQLDLARYQQRIKAAVLAGNNGLAGYLVRQGPSGLAAYRNAWVDLLDAPEQTVEALFANRSAAAPREELIEEGLYRAARNDPRVAWVLANRAVDQQIVDRDTAGRGLRMAALRAGYRFYPEAYQWLSQVPESHRDEEVVTWQVRSALRAQAWSRVNQAIVALPDELREQEQWQYWQAVAFKQTGRDVAARPLFRELAKQPGYYGFLAADQVGMDYALPPRSDGSLPTVSATDIATIRHDPWFRLAKALYRLAYYPDARRVFEHELARVDTDYLPAIAHWAQEVDWSDRVSVAIARMGKQRDPDWFSARYPKPHLDAVRHAAQEQSIPESWIYGVMRRESLFMPDVGSGAGAQGLMQFMPDTASWMNRHSGLNIAPLDLHDPLVSIRLGGAYLGYLFDRFDQQYTLASAAYNAGPGRVNRWMPDKPMPGPVWVDTIVFDETRAYNKAVLEAMIIYQWRSGSVQNRLRDFLPVVVGD